MPGFTRAKKRKQPKKEIKLPTGKVKLQAKDTDVKGDETVRAFSDELMKSEWKSFVSRPREHDLYGFYAVMRWYTKEKTWVVLYVGKGVIRQELDNIFSGRSNDAIGHYMSCFSKSKTNLVWLKWLPEPHDNKEGLDIRAVLKDVGLRYNSCEIPAFNLEHSDLVPNDELPEDFSIIPDWNKKSKTKRKAN